MTVDVAVPPVSEDATDAVLGKWLVSVGDRVTAGQVLCEVETAKATVEVESPADGIVLSVSVAEGDEFPIAGTVIAVLGEQGEAERPPEESASVPTMEEPAAGIHETRGDGVAVAPSVGPVVQRLAAKLGVDLSSVVPTGLHGRILRGDVERAAQIGLSEKAPSSEEKVRRLLRRTISQRMARAKQEIPHFYVEREVMVGPLVRVLGERGQAFTEAVIKAAAVSLVRHYRLNGTINEGEFQPADGVHIGVAVAADDGLYVPVIRNTDGLSLTAIRAAVRNLAEKARERKLGVEELEGGTFTISNLGMFDVTRFSAIVNPPQVAILAVGAVVDRVIPLDGSPVIAPMVSLTLSCDHRAVNGLDAARFLAGVASVLEQPSGDWMD